QPGFPVFSVHLRLRQSPRLRAGPPHPASPERRHLHVSGPLRGHAPFGWGGWARRRACSFASRTILTILTSLLFPRMADSVTHSRIRHVTPLEATAGPCGQPGGSRSRPLPTPGRAPSRSRHAPFAAALPFPSLRSFFKAEAVATAFADPFGLRVG